ncbi:MAG: response regulator [Chloroflexi bacterium]|nr:response regulator [Chloroflexota bacterium]
MVLSDATFDSEAGLFWLHLAADGVIALAYFAISVTLAVLYARLRPQLPHTWIVPAFGLFIVACGGTHVMHMLLALQLPVHGLAVMIQGITLAASLATAVALPTLVPKVVALCSSAKVSEDRKRQLDETQAEKLRVLGQLAGGVAHDLNQSLGIISGYCELATREIDREVPDLVAVVDHLHLVSRAAQDGGATVRRLLTFARGGAAGEPERIDVAQLLSDVAKLTAPRWRDLTQCEGRPVTLTVEAAGDVHVRGASSSLREAVLNLVLNALDALPTGGTISLGAARVTDTVEIRVADSGIGMPADLQTRIFEPFFTTKGERGTGLGLAMVQSIVEHHSGRLSVASAVGEGTVFTIHLPADDDPERPALPVLARRPLAALRVLAVDDEQPLVQLVAALLRPHGHQVVTARSGEAALEVARNRQFDLVISDLGMGDGINGWELAEALSSLQPELVFVLATGWGAEIDEADARQRGVHAVLAKPFRGRQLEQLLERLQHEGLLGVSQQPERALPAARPA